MADASFNKRAKKLSRSPALLLSIFSIQALFATNQQRSSSRIIDLSVEHLTAAREVMGSIPKARPKLRILMRIKVLPLPSKCLDFPMAQIQDSKLKFDFGSTCATRCKFLGAQLKILGAQLIMLGASISKEKVKS